MGGGGGSDGLPVGVKSKVVEGGFQLVSIEITSFAIAPLREQEQKDVGGFSFLTKVMLLLIHIAQLEMGAVNLLWMSE